MSGNSTAARSDRVIFWLTIGCSVAAFLVVLTALAVTYRVRAANKEIAELTSALEILRTSAGSFASRPLTLRVATTVIQQAAPLAETVPKPAGKHARQEPHHGGQHTSAPRVGSRTKATPTKKGQHIATPSRKQRGF